MCCYYEVCHAMEYHVNTIRHWEMWYVMKVWYRIVHYLMKLHERIMLCRKWMKIHIASKTHVMILNEGDFMHIVYSHASEYFPIMISTDTYTTLIRYGVMYIIILCMLPSLCSIRTCMGPCVRMWIMCREVLYIQLYLNV